MDVLGFQSAAQGRHECHVNDENIRIPVLSRSPFPKAASPSFSSPEAGGGKGPSENSP